MVKTGRRGGASESAKNKNNNNNNKLKVKLNTIKKIYLKKIIRVGLWVPLDNGFPTLLHPTCVV